MVKNSPLTNEKMGGTCCFGLIHSNMIHDSYFLPQIASFFEQESLKREISLPLPQQFGECQDLLCFTEFHCVVGFSSPRGGVCEKAKDMETDGEDVEEPSFGPPHHGEHIVTSCPNPKSRPPLFAMIWK